MDVLVNGVRLYFDVEGVGLVPDEAGGMRQRPTLLLLHGGPGFDHTGFKPVFSALTDVAQIVYLDHRGQGRSGGTEDRSRWTLDQWADDVKAFCDALGIHRPIVLGNSFGGFVTQAYALRHPGHAAGLILSSTCARMDVDRIVAMFHRRGGPEAARVAEDFWRDVRVDKVDRYMEVCMPLYTAAPYPGMLPGGRRSIMRPEVLEHFSGPGGEIWRMDFRDGLSKVTSPTLVLAGALDPVTTLDLAEEMADHLPPGLGQLEKFDDCGHGVFRDQPERTMAVIRDFIARVA